MENKRQRLADLREELVKLDERRKVVHDEIEEILYDLGADIQDQETKHGAPMESAEQPIGLAESAGEFYLHGDRGKTDEDQYCNILFLGKNFKCCRRFWGVLLGRKQNNALWEMHVDGWIRRSLVLHQKFIQREATRTLKRYAVMPTVFNDDFLELDWERNVKLATGCMKPYPAWWDVDRVLIPINCPNDHWCLLQFNISTLELTIFDRESSVIPAPYRSRIFTFYEKNIVNFLNEIKYTRRAPVPNAVGPFLYNANLTQYPGSSKQNSALFVCMFIHYLIKNEKWEVVAADVSDEQVKEFRERMADAFYAKRIG